MVTIVVGDNTYLGSLQDAKDFKKIAKENIPNGIYCVEKSDYYEFKNEQFDSYEKLEKAAEAYVKEGFGVRANWNGKCKRFGQVMAAGKKKVDREAFIQGYDDFAHGRTSINKLTKVLGLCNVTISNRFRYIIEHNGAVDEAWFKD